MKRFSLMAARSALGILVVLAVAMLFARWSTVLETPTNFRPHLLLVALPVVVVVAILGTRRDLAVGLLPLLLLGVPVAPYLTGGSEPVPASRAAVRVLQYNVLYSNTDHDAILAEIRAANADLVGLHELTTEQWEVLEPALRDEYPYALADPVYLPGPGSNGGGKAVLSRTPIAPVPVESSFPLPPLAVTTELQGEDVLVVALHPSPARTNDWLVAQREDKLAAVARTVAHHDGPAMIIADLNIAPTSPDYGRFLDSLQWQDPRRAIGITPTFPAQGWARSAGIAIDHVFASPEFIVHDYTLGGGGGSDHRSLVATLSLDRTAPQL
jgi:endonuclease/exonuclease/phosphatase (EEP) superfamily protein YafD